MFTSKKITANKELGSMLPSSCCVFNPRVNSWVKNLMTLTLILILTGCGDIETSKPLEEISNEEQEVVPTERKQAIEPVKEKKGMKPTAKKTQTDKTYFSFSEKNIQLKKEEKETIEVQFTPTYNPVSSVEVHLQYDSQKLDISNLIAGKDIIPFYSNIDPEVGTIEFIAATSETLFGENLPLFTIEISRKEAAKMGETILEFDNQKISALLPDIENTETAIREDIPKLIISLSSP